MGGPSSLLHLCRLATLRRQGNPGESRVGGRPMPVLFPGMNVYHIAGGDNFFDRFRGEDAFSGDDA